MLIHNQIQMLRLLARQGFRFSTAPMSAPMSVEIKKRVDFELFKMSVMNHLMPEYVIETYRLQKYEDNQALYLAQTCRRLSKLIKTMNKHEMSELVKFAGKNYENLNIKNIQQLQLNQIVDIVSMALLILFDHPSSLSEASKKVIHRYLDEFLKKVDEGHDHQRITSLVIITSRISHIFEYPRYAQFLKLTYRLFQTHEINVYQVIMIFKYILRVNSYSYIPLEFDVCKLLLTKMKEQNFLDKFDFPNMMIMCFTLEHIEAKTAYFLWKENYNFFLEEIYDYFLKNVHIIPGRLIGSIISRYMRTTVKNSKLFYIFSRVFLEDLANPKQKFMPIFLLDVFSNAPSKHRHYMEKISPNFSKKLCQLLREILKEGQRSMNSRIHYMYSAMLERFNVSQILPLRMLKSINERLATSYDVIQVITQFSRAMISFSPHMFHRNRPSFYSDNRILIKPLYEMLRRVDSLSPQLVAMAQELLQPYRIVPKIKQPKEGSNPNRNYENWALIGLIMEIYSRQFMLRKSLDLLKETINARILQNELQLIVLLLNSNLPEIYDQQVIEEVEKMSGTFKEWVRTLHLHNITNYMILTEHSVRIFYKVCQKFSSVLQIFSLGNHIFHQLQYPKLRNGFIETLIGIIQKNPSSDFQNHLWRCFEYSLHLIFRYHQLQTLFHKILQLEIKIDAFVQYLAHVYDQHFGSFQLPKPQQITSIHTLRTLIQAEEQHRSNQQIPTISEDATRTQVYEAILRLDPAKKSQEMISFIIHCGERLSNAEGGISVKEQMKFLRLLSFCRDQLKLQVREIPQFYRNVLKLIVESIEENGDNLITRLLILEWMVNNRVYYERMHAICLQTANHEKYSFKVHEQVLATYPSPKSELLFLQCTRNHPYYHDDHSYIINSIKVFCMVQKPSNQAMKYVLNLKDTLNLVLPEHIDKYLGITRERDRKIFGKGPRASLEINREGDVVEIRGLESHGSFFDLQELTERHCVDKAIALRAFQKQFKDQDVKFVFAS